MKSIIEKHKKAAIESEEAAKFHHEAAKQYETGDNETADLNSKEANNHSTNTAELEKEILKQHIKALFKFKK
ncbi:MAG: hypothetical protein HY951_05140 [Bacteroidia bacterium]|nr:hypothetical protein [Bacteroidia bacterium]